MRITQMTSCIAALAVLGLVAGCSACGDLPGVNEIGSLFSDDCAPTPVAQAPAPCDPPPVAYDAPPPVVAAQPVVDNTRPPDARPGEVWCYVRVPGVTRTEEERVCVRQASYRDIPVPAVTRQVERRVCVRQASTRQETIPAEYQNVAEQFCTAQARTEWARVDCNPTQLAQREKVGERWTLREVPAQYQTRTKRVCVREAACRTIQIPAEFQTQLETVVVTPASTRREVIPAEYETRLKEVPVCGPRWEWRRTTECEVPEAAPAPMGGNFVPGGDFVPQPAPIDAPVGNAGIGNPDNNIPPAGGLPPLR